MIPCAIELTIPAREDMLLIARMALSGVCVRCGFSLDAVEDARIAADEACYCLMHQCEPAASLRMTCRWDDTRLSIAFASVRECGESSVPSAELDPDRSDESGQLGESDQAALARSILETLVTSAKLSVGAFGVYSIQMEIDYKTNAANAPPDRDG
ncbi:MAG: hypothetical protein LBB86_03095 [Oscillospiraceae bacterium]|jgi:hypothetical protein|nr:hypothetical protein [Oscillospiraceae bacterium]